MRITRALAAASAYINTAHRYIHTPIDARVQSRGSFASAIYMRRSRAAVITVIYLKIQDG